MHVIVIHRDQEVTQEQVQSVAAALGVTAFDARQRLVCQSPVVASVHAEPQRAEELQRQFLDSGLHAFVVDVNEAMHKRPVFKVQSFKFEDDAICVQDAGGRKASIPYSDIKVVLPCTLSTQMTEVNTVTEKKLSVGKTLMAGGLPMTKKVTRKETVTRDEHDQVLYLCSRNRARLVCGQSVMAYGGFGDEMKPSREGNFSLFTAKIRQRCHDAVYDERLLKRSEQVKLLGPMLDPARYIDLAVDILVATFLLPEKS